MVGVLATLTSIMNEVLTTKELDRIATVLASGPYEGYPEPASRLYVGAAGLHLAGVTLQVPDGPWHIANHPNRRGKDDRALDPDVPGTAHPVVPAELTNRWRSDGLQTDQYGRPIHPNWQQLLGDERIGLPTGLGFFYRYGANATVDPVVYRRRQPQDEPEYLLIQREKGRTWALPGGFLDRTDASAEAAARREAAEETQLDAIGGHGEVILHKRPVGLRDTLHAWTENTVVLLHGNQEYLYDTLPVASDDAIDAGWFSRASMASLPMFDAHPQYISRADELLRAAA